MNTMLLTTTSSTSFTSLIQIS